MPKLILFQNNKHILKANKENVGRGSVVGSATRYGLDGPGIESLWG